MLPQKQLPKGVPPYLDEPPPSPGLGHESDQLTPLHSLIASTMCSLCTIINECPQNTTQHTPGQRLTDSQKACLWAHLETLPTRVLLLFLSAAQLYLHKKQTFLPLLQAGQLSRSSGRSEPSCSPKNCIISCLPRPC